MLRPFAGWVALSVLLGTATVAASIGLLGTSAYLIARAAQHPSIAVLQVAVVGVRFFGISRGVLRYLERLVSHSVNFQLLARLRTWFYRSLEPLVPARLLDHRSGDLLSRAVADIETLENFYVRAVAPPLVALLVTVGVSLFAGQYHPALALLLLGLMAVAAIGLPLLAHLLNQMPGREIVTRRAEMGAGVVEVLQGMGDLQVFGQEEAYLQRILASGRALGAAQQWSGMWGALANALTLLLNGLALWGVLVFGIPLVGGVLDGITLAVLALVALSSFEAVTPLAPAAQHLGSSLKAADRLFHLVDGQPEVNAPPQPLAPPQTPDLCIQHLTFRYAGGDPPALKDFSLDLPPGRRVALVGPSGSGKTTLINLLLRFWDCPPGAIYLDGRDIRQYDPDDACRRVVVITQDTYLFSGTLRQNLLLACPQAGEADLAAVVEGARLGELAVRLPNGLDTWIGERGVQLSGGERQRVALGRALLRLRQSGPGLLILDEPTRNLDPLNERLFLQSLDEAAQGHSLLMVTHHLAGLESMDEILVLRAGQVIERGTQAALLTRAGDFSRMWQIYQHSLP